MVWHLSGLARPRNGRLHANLFGIMSDLMALAIFAVAIFAAGVVVGRAFGRAQGFDEARRLWRDPTDEAGA